MPANGVYLAAYHQGQADPATHITVGPASMTEYSTDVTSYQTSSRSLCIGISNATGLIAVSFGGTFGSYPRAGAVFKAAET